jgi:hypothetical protein
MEVKCAVAYDQPRPPLQATMMTMTMTPKLLTLLAQQPNRRQFFFKIYDLKDKAQHKMYTNQTGKFPKKSSRGNQYIMVLIEIDSNTILVAAMKNRLAGKMCVC